MAYKELLKEINEFDVSVLNPEQLKTLKEALQIKTSCVNFYQRIAYARKRASNSQEKCEE